MATAYKVDVAGVKGWRSYFDTLEEARSYRLSMARKMGVTADRVRVWERKPGGGYLLLYGQKR
jgi:hypothetical protein